MATHRLSTRLQIACRRAAALKAEAHAAEFARRLDPAAYNCTRTGEPGARVWTAEGPAGQRFEFRELPGPERDVECRSQSGMAYIIRVDGDDYRCSCPVEPPCKHLSAFEAVRMAHKMARDDVRRALRAEAAAMRDEDPAAGYEFYYPGEGL